MNYELPSKDLLEKRSKELISNDLYNLSKITFKKDLKDNLIIPIGIDNNKEKYYIDLNDKSAILIVGETGSGKSTFIHSMIISLLMKNTPNDIDFLLIDYRNIEFNCYYKLPNLLIPSIKEIEHIFEERTRLFIDNKVKNINSYNELNKDKLKHIFIFIDEHITFFENTENMKIINEILTQGYKYGIHLILSTSSYLKDNLNKDLINKFNMIISFDLASKEQANYININNADLLKINGDALIKQKENIYNIQTPYVSEKDIENITNFIFKQKNN